VEATKALAESPNTKVVLGAEAPHAADGTPVEAEGALGEASDL
jgi:hypothetical protein